MGLNETPALVASHYTHSRVLVMYIFSEVRYKAQSTDIEVYMCQIYYGYWGLCLIKTKFLTRVDTQRLS